MVMEDAFVTSRKRRVAAPGPPIMTFVNSAEPDELIERKLVTVLMFGNIGGRAPQSVTFTREKRAACEEEETWIKSDMPAPPSAEMLLLVKDMFEIVMEDCTHIAAVEDPAGVVMFSAGGMLIHTGVDEASRLGWGETVHWSQRVLKTT